MSRSHRPVMWASLLLTLLVADSGAQPTANLLPNAGFEEGDGPTPVGWEGQAPFSNTFRAS